MTNAEIIFQNRIFLMEQGVIRGIPGTSVTVKDEQGEREVLMPEEIHTYNAWKKLGYQVQKGEHAVAKFPIWKFRTNKKQEQEADEEQEVSGRCFMKVAFFFTMGQVAPIKQEEVK